MYKIQVKINGTWIVFNDANLEGVSITKAIESGFIFARQTVGGSILFYGSDFVLLEENISSIQLEAQIYRTEPEATGVVTGYLNLYGVWDYDRKTCELQFNVSDDYTALLERWDEDVVRSVNNWDQYYPTVNLISETQILTIVNPIIPVTATEHNWVYVSSINGVHTYKKQIIYLPANLWEVDESLPVFGSTVVSTETATLNGVAVSVGDYLFPVIRYAYSRQLQLPQEVTITLPLFSSLYSYLNKYLDLISYDLTTATWNTYFDADEDLQNLMFAQKSKILDPDSLPNSKLPTIKQVFELFKIMFNLDWYISGGDNVCFKHPSENVLELPNFTTYPWHDIETWTNQQRKSTYKGDELPYKEMWQTEKTYEQDFDGFPIRYSEAISREQITYELTQWQTNLKAVMLAGDTDAIRKEDISDDGYVLIACNPANGVIQKPGIIWPDQNLINGKLALARLHDEHFKDGDRYFATGEMNEETTTFTNIRKRKEVMHKIPAFITDFSFDYLVRTAHGNMRIVSITEYCNGQFTEIKLEY